MGLTQYLGSLVRGWYLLVAGLLLGALLAVAHLQLTTPEYTSNTQLFVSTTGSSDLSAAAQGGQFSQQRTASYAQLLGGRDLAALVIDDLGLDTTPDALVQEISAQVLPETVILDVTVTDPSPTRALAIAESIGTQFTELVATLETPPGAQVAPLQVSVVATPELPTSPSSPVLLPTLLAGLVGGLLLGAAVAVVRDRLDTSIRDDTGAETASGAPVLGLIPDVDRAGTQTVEGQKAVPEAFRVVRGNLQFVSVDAKARVLMMTSAEPGEGKTTTTIGLAEVLADAGRRVLVIEADLRRPRVTRYLNLVSGAGLTNVLTETAELSDVLQPLGDGTLTVLAAGPTPPNPSELLSSEAMSALLDRVSSEFDVVLLDAPPLLPVADAAGLATLVDGVLLCLRWGHTGRDGVERSRALLDRAGARTMGVILTFVPRRAAGTYEYSYSEAEATPPRVAWLQRQKTPPTTTSTVARSASTAAADTGGGPPVTRARPLTVREAARGAEPTVSVSVPPVGPDGPVDDDETVAAADDPVAASTPASGPAPEAGAVPAAQTTEPEAPAPRSTSAPTTPAGLGSTRRTGARANQRSTQRRKKDRRR